MLNVFQINLVNEIIGMCIVSSGSTRRRRLSFCVR